MVVQTNLQICLSGISDSLDKLRKDMLWPNGHDTHPDPDAGVVMTWEQMERFFACQQRLIDALALSEDMRIQNIVGRL